MSHERRYKQIQGRCQQMSSSERERLELLQEEEQELERLRMLVRPEYWPRIYAMLKRIREEIREEEASLGTRDRAA